MSATIHRFPTPRDPNGHRPWRLNWFAFGVLLGIMAACVLMWWGIAGMTSAAFHFIRLRLEI